MYRKNKKPLRTAKRWDLYLCYFTQDTHHLSYRADFIICYTYTRILPPANLLCLFTSLFLSWLIYVWTWLMQPTISTIDKCQTYSSISPFFGIMPRVWSNGTMKWRERETGSNWSNSLHIKGILPNIIQLFFALYTKYSLNRFKPSLQRNMWLTWKCWL